MSTASWSMQQDAAVPLHWWSTVDCPHGRSRSGGWFVQVVDDRNFLDLAQPTFANHQARYADCECALEIGYSPSYSPTGGMP
jgi:hypothetical protein